MSFDHDGAQAPRGPVKAPQELAAGLFLMFFAAVLYYNSLGLRFGQMRGIGPGFMPQITALLLGVFGGVLAVQAFLSNGLRLAAWSLRGLFFILGSVILFAMTVRGIDVFGLKLPAFGLIVAGPLVVLVSSLADRDTRLVEVVLYAIGINIFCGLLFKEALGLPIPYDPMGLVPEVIANAYKALKGVILQHRYIAGGVVSALLLGGLAYLLMSDPERNADREGR
jgi:hypothetical protein